MITKIRSLFPTLEAGFSIDMNYYTHPHQSDRLMMRPLTINDTSSWNPFMHSKEATALFPPSYKLPKFTAEDWIEKQQKRYAEKTFGLLALIDKENDKMIGQAGLLKQSIDERSFVEVGYHILPEHWKKGYAREAVQYFMQYAFSNFNFGKVIALIHPDNEASKRVAISLGMKLLNVVLHHEESVEQFYISQEAFRQ